MTAAEAAAFNLLGMNAPLMSGSYCVPGFLSEHIPGGAAAERFHL